METQHGTLSRVMCAHWSLWRGWEAPLGSLGLSAKTPVRLVISQSSPASRSATWGWGFTVTGGEGAPRALGVCAGSIPQGSLLETVTGAFVLGKAKGSSLDLVLRC